ncbi:putative short-chain dehydrogenase/reductase family 16C member 6 [Penaeus vannamei]|uniref:Putative short-chain dehydrogenase/reductase family 16C member 6 n=1 Tax=Penaeus vannamei TaxID=6689 RepID=A0A423TFU7_PENVA|nr:putative short-chain dehydrogenase/reductase family 16C member 6 [Penaeus vannamei]
MSCQDRKRTRRYRVARTPALLASPLLSAAPDKPSISVPRASPRGIDYEAAPPRAALERASTSESRAVENGICNDETVRQVSAAGGECWAYTVDLCDRHSIYKVAARVKEEVGKVDILVNNAGIVTGRNFIDSPDELIQKTFEVNIMSHFWTTKAFLPDMISANKGHVVTVASLAGLSGVNKLADYCASKFAAVGFDETSCPRRPLCFWGESQELALPWMSLWDAGKATKITLSQVSSILPFKGAYRIYKACGGHISMDGFQGRSKDLQQQLKMTNGPEKQKPQGTPEV